MVGELWENIKRKSRKTKVTIRIIVFKDLKIKIISHIINNNKIYKECDVCMWKHLMISWNIFLLFYFKNSTT